MTASHSMPSRGQAVCRHGWRYRRCCSSPTALFRSSARATCLKRSCSVSRPQSRRVGVEHSHRLCRAAVARLARHLWPSARSPPTISICGFRAAADCRLHPGGRDRGRVGILFGLPSLRLRGFYLAVSTLAAQFFVKWALTRFGWLSNYNSSGVIDAPPLTLVGVNSRGRSAVICSRSPSLSW